MTAHPNQTGASLIPTVRYRNVGAAIAWLEKAFGLEPHRVVKDSQGRVLYGELTFGTGMVMVAPIQESPFGRLMVQPDEIGGVETQVCYLFVEDARAHYARAKAAGAEIVLDVDAAAKGGRGYSCRDPEGHVWNFGTYDPWDLRSGTARRSSRRKRKILSACLLLGIAGGAYLHEPTREAASDLARGILAKIWGAVATAQADQSPGPVASETTHPASYDRYVRDIREQLALERRAREAAELAAKSAREGHDRIASAAQSAAVDTRNELADVRSKLQAALEELSRARMAKEAAERKVGETREEFARLDDARETAEQAARWARNLAARERRRRIVAERTLRIAKRSPNTPYPLHN